MEGLLLTRKKRIIRNGLMGVLKESCNDGDSYVFFLFIIILGILFNFATYFYYYIR